VDEAWFSVDKRARPHDKPYFVFVGNLKVHKNVAGLVNAFRRVAETVPHDLIIVGKKEGFITGTGRWRAGPPRWRAREVHGPRRRRAAEEICRLGGRPRAAVLLRRLRIASLEAMACGCPAIVSDRASLPEVCGDASCIVTRTTSRTSQPECSRWRRARRRAPGCGEKGLRRARQFTWDKCARETLAVIERLQS